MKPTDLLWVQIALALFGVWRCRHLLRSHWTNLFRLLVFIAAASYSFDYVANDRRVWLVNPGWNLTVIINPFENTLFAVTMAIHLILLGLWVEHHIAKNNR